MKKFVRMFQPRFAELVQQGKKTRTIRPVPRRMPKAGDLLSLRCWEGLPYRSKQRILCAAVVVSVVPVVLAPALSSWDVLVDGRLLTNEELADFARADGFACVADFMAFFQTGYGLPFLGVLIEWEVRP